jgi:hypothetical protein
MCVSVTVRLVMLDRCHSSEGCSSYLVWLVIQKSGARGDKAECDIFIAFECPVQLPRYLCTTCYGNIKSDLCPLVFKYFCWSRPWREIPLSDRYLRLYINTVVISYYINMCHSEAQSPSGSTPGRFFSYFHTTWCWLFSIASRPALRPTHSHKMGNGGCFPWGKATGASSWPLISI